tara:strand:- start:351 stop:467 length:117 start_codon:yes stop_codon:yes gene_type:complete
MGAGLRDGLLGRGWVGIYIVAAPYSNIYNTEVNIQTTM